MVLVDTCQGSFAGRVAYSHKGFLATRSMAACNIVAAVAAAATIFQQAERDSGPISGQVTSNGLLLPLRNSVMEDID